MSTVASYFSLNMDSTEREAETAVVTIRSNLFLISNLQGVGFANTSGKHISIPDPEKRPADLTYFTFRSVVVAVDVDDCAPEITLSVEFSLRLPQTIVSLSPSAESPIAAIISTTRSPNYALSVSFKLGNCTDEIIDALRVYDMCLLFDQGRTAPSPDLPSAVQPSILFSTTVSTSNATHITSLTPKIDCVRSVR